MAGFSDLFSAENVGNLMQDPRMMLGLQLMAQGRQGSSSQALGQAGGQAVQMYAQQKHQQGLADYRRQMIEAQQADTQLRQQAAQAKADQQRQYQQRLQDPNFLAGLSPQARILASLGVDPDTLARGMSADNQAAHRAASLAQQQSQFDQRIAHQGGGGQSSGPRAPAPRAFVDQPLGGDMYQRYQFDAQSGGYQPWGEPFNKHSTRKPKATHGADAAVDAILNPALIDQEPVPDTSALPGTGNLQSYAPQPKQPIGVLPMAAQGGGASAVQQPAPKVGTRVPGQAQIARPLTKADYDALPAGSQYIDPVSGKTATKRG